MKKLIFALMIACIPALSFAGDMKHTNNMTEKNIVETAIESGSFETLVSLVQEAGLVDTLSGPGPFTLFAPTDEAFSKVSEEMLQELKADKKKLTEVLKYHLVSGKVPASKVVTLSKAQTVEGSSVTINTKDGVRVNDAKVTKTDIQTSNGIIHVIDSVLLPTE